MLVGSIRVADELGCSADGLELFWCGGWVGQVLKKGGCEIGLLGV